MPAPTPLTGRETSPHVEPGGTPDPVVRALDVVKTYPGPDGRVIALDRTSFTAHHGRLTVITGPSGSGKSTLLQVLAGLDRPDSGRVVIGGQDIARLGDRAASAFRRRRLGFVFQSSSLIDSLTARENILFPSEIDGRRTDPARLHALADRLGIADRLDHLPAQLSGGQQQRVAVARALYADPDVIFADEPTGALDPQTAAQLVAMLRGLVDEHGYAVVVVTHDVEVARQADDLWVMDTGVLTRREVAR